MMIETRMKIIALSIVAMISFIGLGGAVVASIDLTIFVNEHVSLSASPGTSGGQYIYLWDANWAISENGVPLSDLSQNPLIFDAPSTAGDYTINVLVADSLVPTNCKAEQTINLHVKECCPTVDENYCTEDSPSWCWYDSCGGDPTAWAIPWDTEPSSIVFSWYVPSTATQTVFTGPCYDPDLGALPFVLPDSVTPTTENSVRLDVTQITTAHGGESITLYSCPKTFNLHWVPELSVSLST